MTYERDVAILLRAAGVEWSSPADLAVTADRLLAEGDRLGLYLAALGCPELQSEVADEVAGLARIAAVSISAQAMSGLQEAMEEFGRQVAASIVPSFREMTEAIGEMMIRVDLGAATASAEPSRRGPSIGPQLRRRLR